MCAQMPSEAEEPDPLELELQAVSHPAWVLGPKLRFSARAASVPNHQSISPPQVSYNFAVSGDAEHSKLLNASRLKDKI